jgi:hypothetical protein
MAKITALTDSDIRVLKEIIAQVESQRTNIPSRPATDRTWSEAEDHQAPEVYVGKPFTVCATESTTGTGGGGAEEDTDRPVVPGLVRAAHDSRDYDLLGEAQCDIYGITMNSSDEPEMRQNVGLRKRVYNPFDVAVGNDYAILVKDKRGRYLPIQHELVHCCLAEDHPGYCEEFQVWLGVWNATTHRFVYATTAENKRTAIDFHYGVPYPSAGARGWFRRMASDTECEILVNVSMDCTSPGACDTDPCPGT